MTQEETTGADFQSIWEADHSHADMDEDCSPTKVCRNMRHVTFEGFGDTGDDPAQAWKARLEREGKLAGGSLADLVFGDGPRA